MAIFTTKLIRKKEVAKDSIEFLFEKPYGLEFCAGNSFDWKILNPKESDRLGNTKTLSCVTSPSEDNIGFAVRMRNTPYKNNLRYMKIGEAIQIEGPFGTFNIPKKNSKSIVFLVGGIGITPCISILKQVVYKNFQYSIYLLYSNRCKKDAAYFNELKSLANDNKFFTFIPIMTQMDTWSGEKEHISISIIKKYINNLYSVLYFLSGKPEMIQSMRDMLLCYGIDEDNLKWEELAGY